MARAHGRALAVTSVVILAIAIVSGCKEDDDGPKNGNGVNDVRLACEIRTKWNRTGNDCSICEAAVVSPRCDCTTLAAFGAACIDQENARKRACAGATEALDKCIFACDRTNCTCVEACYANDPCKAASAARDGCLTETCDPHCK